MRRIFNQLAIFAMFPLLAWGTENFPPPEFRNGYNFPQYTHPGPRSEMFLLIDVAMLALTLGLAAYFILKMRSRPHLQVLGIFSILYFGFYRQGCVCAVGAIQNVAMSIGQSGYALSFGIAAFFLLPLLVALFMGRVFCGGVCPLGAVQDLLLQRPVRVPSWLEHSLGLLPAVYLGAAVLFAATGSAFVICMYDPFVALFRLSGSITMLICGGALLLLAVFVGRPYCRFLCPYGVLLRVMAPLAKWRMRITHQECVKCHLCADACPFGAIHAPTAPPISRDRYSGRGRLALLLLALPLLVVLGGWLGYHSVGTLYRMHPTVQQAEAALALDRGHFPIDPASPNIALYRHAQSIRRQFLLGGKLFGKVHIYPTMLFGMWLGLIVACKLLWLSRRRQRSEYEIDQAACLSCGRCYQVCPVERVEMPTDIHVPPS